MEMNMAGISSQLLKKIIADQQEDELIPQDYHYRSSEKKLKKLMDNKEITVITGVRRCGKSVFFLRICLFNEYNEYVTYGGIPEYTKHYQIGCLYALYGGSGRGYYKRQEEI